MAPPSDASTSSAPKPIARKLVAVKDLPLYKDESVRPLDSYKFVEDGPVPLEKECRAIRLNFCEKYAAFAAKFQRADRAISSVRDTLNDTQRYLATDEASVLPKAAAISVGGMAGLVVSLRRHGPIRKVIYPTVGLAVMAAFCYPNEAIDFAQIGVAHAQRTWEDFRKSPEPETTKAKK